MSISSQNRLLGGLFLFLTGSAFAELPPILITAGRIAETTEETLRSVTVVERDAIEQQQPRDVSEILRRAPGVEVGRTGGPGQQTSVFLRGTESDHTLVLIDGVPINPATIGGAAFQHLMPDQIDRIEVVRGPLSTLYGSSAIGGVIQIFTRRPADGTRAQVTALAGTEDTVNGTVALSHADERFDVSLALSHLDTAGYPTRQSPFLQVDQGYRNTSFNGTVGAAIDGGRVEFSHFRAEGLVEYLGGFGPPGTPLDQDTENTVTRLALDYAASPTWDTQLLAARATDRIDQNQSVDTIETIRDYVDWQNTFRLTPGNTLVAGANIAWTDARDESGSLFDFDVFTRSIEGYVSDTFTIDDTRVQLDARMIDNSQFGSHLTWGLGLGRAVGPSTTLRANLGTAFRAPSAADLYGFGGDPDLDPETSLAGEIGIDQALTGNSSLRVTLFQTDIDDLIEVRDLGGFNFQAIQVEQARIRGIELGYRYAAGRWSLTADYTHQDAKNRSLDERLGRRARNIASATVQYAAPRWWTEATAMYQDERPDFTGSTTLLGAYSTLDISAGYRISPALSVTGRVQNLFDEAYELAATYPAQGRFVSVQLTYAYDAQR